MKMLKINDSISVEEFAQYLEWAFQKKKNGVQDLEKAKWYLDHLIDHIKNLEKEN